MPGAEPSRSTHRDSGKQKGSSKTVKRNFREAFTNRFAVGSELGPSGTRRLVNHKARGRRSQPREDTASLASDRSNGSRGATRSVNDGDGFAEGVHAADVLPGDVHPDYMRPDNMRPDSVHQGTVHPEIHGRRQPGGDTASVASGKSHKSTGTGRSVNNGSGSTRSVRSGQSNHSTGTRRNVDNGNGSAGGELPGSVHHDSGGGGGGGGGEAGAEGLGEEEGLGREEDHDGGEVGGGRGEDHDGGEVGGGNDDGGTEVVGQGAGTDANAGTSDAEQALAGPGNNDTNERDLSEHSEEGRAVEDDHAGTGEGAIVGERDGDGDGNGETNTCRIMVVWERE